jgi:hypothetical protein
VAAAGAYLRGIYELRQDTYRDNQERTSDNKNRYGNMEEGEVEACSSCNRQNSHT